MVPIWCEDTCISLDGPIIHMYAWTITFLFTLPYIIFLLLVSSKKIPILKQVIMMNVKNLECSHLGLCCQINALQKRDFFIKFRFHEVKTMGSSTCWSLTNKLYWCDPCLTQRWTPQRYALFFIYYSQYNVSTSREHGFSTHKNYMPTII